MVRRFSFWCTQEVPARHFRILRREVTLEERFWTWGVKVKWVSKVTPRMVGVLSKGRRELLMKT